MPDEPVSLDPRRAAKRWHCSVQYLYNLLNDGSIRSVKVGGRRFVSVASGDALFGVARDEPEQDVG
jgi:hypothetical protein